MLNISCGIKGQELPLKSLRFGKNKGFVGSLEDSVIKRFAQTYFSLFEEFKEIHPCLPPSIASQTPAVSAGRGCLLLSGQRLLIF